MLSRKSMLAKGTLSSILSNMQTNPNEPWILPHTEDKVSSGPLSDDWIFDRLAVPREAVRAELTCRGFVFTPDVDGFRPLLENSARLLATVTTLEAAVERSVLEIILLNAPDGYDISHSEPRWPETIFVSASKDPGQIGALRMLENVVHEAMHLQLTKLEESVPLIADEVSQMASPWREEPRHLLGILHGAYVFTCIHTFFGRAELSRRLDGTGSGYVAKRRREIGDELRQIDFDRLAAGLTSEGFAFLDVKLRGRARR
jgi:hypothetical protein